MGPGTLPMHASADSFRDDEKHRLHGWDAVLHGRYPVGGPGPQYLGTEALCSPQSNYQQLTELAWAKNRYPLPKLVVLGVLAGAYIGLGYSLCCLVGGQLSFKLRHEQPGLFNFLFSVFGFPMGLTLCVVAGADLFTSNCMYAALALAEGKYGVLGAARALSVSYVSNLAGALMLMGMMVGGDVFYGDRSAFVIELAIKKTSAGFGTTLMRGILCNWLVCLAVWMGSQARDLTGRFVGIFLPNSAFVAMGFEHCVANMFLIPMSMALGSGISVGTFVGRNLVPATLGNLIGGSVFVAMSYSAAFGSPGHAISGAWEAGVEKAACGASAAAHRLGSCCMPHSHPHSRIAAVGSSSSDGKPAAASNGGDACAAGSCGGASSSSSSANGGAQTPLAVPMGGQNGSSAAGRDVV